MIIDIRLHKPQKEDKFFLDTNIWIFIFCPLAGAREASVTKYSRFFKKMIQNNSKMYTSSGIISEFINSYLRMDHKQNNQDYPDYKRDYRNSSCYTSTFNIVKQIVNNKILPYVIKLDDRFSSLNFDDIINEAENTDFNDSLFANMLKSTDISVLTDDFDFYHLRSNNNIYTGNSRLIARK